jgi:hypothetical protein
VTEVDRLADELLDAILGEEDPLAGTALGVRGHEDRLPDHSPAGREGLRRRVTGIADRARTRTLRRSGAKTG